MKRAFLPALAFLALGCAIERGQAFEAAFAAGERAFHAGRFDEAAAEFEKAAAAANRVKDRDEALYLESRTQTRAAHYDAAKATLGRLEKVSPAGPRGGRASFDIAQIEIEHGNEEQGYRLLEAAVRAHPGHGLARPSVMHIVKHLEDKGGTAASLAWLRAQTSVYRGTEQEQSIAYETAGAFERAGDRDAAHDIYVETAIKHPYPFGGLTDDAWFHAAELDEKRGRFDEAIQHLRTLIAPREKADTIGSYERPKYSDAQMRIAEIYRDKLHDDAAARREFHVLYASFTTSRHRDQALWAEARIAAKQHDDGGACDAASRLVREFPESRYAACATLVCASAPAAEKAKRPCADYIREELEKK